MHDLQLLEDLVNTRFADGGTDDLTSPAALAAWLAERGVDARVTGRDLDRVLVVREGLRAVLVANNDGQHAGKSAASGSR